jgi:hypothetical protein
MDLAGCSKVSEEKVDLACTLFDVKVATVETLMERAEKYKFALRGCDRSSFF